MADLGGQYQDAIARRLNLDLPDDGLPRLPETGHPVRFLNYGPYYNLGSSAQRSVSNAFSGCVKFQSVLPVPRKPKPGATSRTLAV